MRRRKRRSVETEKRHSVLVTVLSGRTVVQELPVSVAKVGSSTSVSLHDLLPPSSHVSS